MPIYAENYPRISLLNVRFSRFLSTIYIVPTHRLKSVKRTRELRSRLYGTESNLIFPFHAGNAGNALQYTNLYSIYTGGGPSNRAEVQNAFYTYTHKRGTNIASVWKSSCACIIYRSKNKIKAKELYNEIKRAAIDAAAN